MTDLLSQLPEYDPRPDLWARIEADLDSDAMLARLVGDLPDYAPKTDLWDAIDQQLTQSATLPDVPVDKPPGVRPLWPQADRRPVWAGLATAAVLVLVGTWLVLRPGATEAVRMEYTVEQATVLPTAAGSDASAAADRRAEEFIARQCAENQLACQRPEVHELRSQLADLTAEQQRIDRERLTFGNDPTLTRAQVKIENQRAHVTKELITRLRS